MPKLQLSVVFRIIGVLVAIIAAASDRKEIHEIFRDLLKYCKKNKYIILKVTSGLTLVIFIVWFALAHIGLIASGNKFEYFLSLIVTIALGFFSIVGTVISIKVLHAVKSPIENWNDLSSRSVELIGKNKDFLCILSENPAFLQLISPEFPKDMRKSLNTSDEGLHRVFCHLRLDHLLQRRFPAWLLSDKDLATQKIANARNSPDAESRIKTLLSELENRKDKLPKETCDALSKLSPPARVDLAKKMLHLQDEVRDHMIGLAVGLKVKWLPLEMRKLPFFVVCSKVEAILTLVDLDKDLSDKSLKSGYFSSDRQMVDGIRKMVSVLAAENGLVFQYTGTDHTQCNIRKYFYEDDLVKGMNDGSYIDIFHVKCDCCKNNLELSPKRISELPLSEQEDIMDYYFPTI